MYYSLYHLHNCKKGKYVTALKPGHTVPYGLIDTFEIWFTTLSFIVTRMDHKSKTSLIGHIQKKYFTHED